MANFQINNQNLFRPAIPQNPRRDKREEAPRQQSAPTTQPTVQPPRSRVRSQNLQQRSNFQESRDSVGLRQARPSIDRNYERAKQRTLNQLNSDHNPKNVQSDIDHNKFTDFHNKTQEAFDELQRLEGQARSRSNPRLARMIARAQGRFDARYEHLQEMRREYYKQEIQHPNHGDYSGGYRDTKNSLRTNLSSLSKRGLEAERDKSTKAIESKKAEIKDLQDLREQERTRIYPNSVDAERVRDIGRLEASIRAHEEHLEAVNKQLDLSTEATTPQRQRPLSSSQRTAAYNQAKENTRSELYREHDPTDINILGNGKFQDFYNRAKAAHEDAQRLAASSRDQRAIATAQGKADAHYEHMQDMRREYYKQTTYSSEQQELSSKDLSNLNREQLTAEKERSEAKIAQQDRIIRDSTRGLSDADRDTKGNKGPFDPDSRKLPTRAIGRAEGTRQAHQEHLDAINQRLSTVSEQADSSVETVNVNNRVERGTRADENFIVDREGAYIITGGGKDSVQFKGSEDEYTVQAVPPRRGRRRNNEIHVTNNSTGARTIVNYPRGQSAPTINFAQGSSTSNVDDNTEVQDSNQGRFRPSNNVNLPSNVKNLGFDRDRKAREIIVDKDNPRRVSLGGIHKYQSNTFQFTAKSGDTIDVVFHSDSIDVRNPKNVEDQIQRLSAALKRYDEQYKLNEGGNPRQLTLNMNVEADNQNVGKGRYFDKDDYFGERQGHDYLRAIVSENDPNHPAHTITAHEFTHFLQDKDLEFGASSAWTEAQAITNEDDGGKDWIYHRLASQATRYGLDKPEALSIKDIIDHFKSYQFTERYNEDYDKLYGYGALFMKFLEETPYRDGLSYAQALEQRVEAGDTKPFEKYGDGLHRVLNEKWQEFFTNWVNNRNNYDPENNPIRMVNVEPGIFDSFQDRWDVA